MSAESHQKRTPSTSSVEGVRLAPNIVPPQAVSDRSIIDSVAGFINDVALTNAPQTDPKEHILWVKFESLADISDTCLGEDWDVEGNLPPPLLLCIGYGSGVQVWAIPANGEAIEVMSWKHGAVKVLRILPTPFLSNNSELASDLLDQFIHKRPLMALCGDGGPIANQPSSQQSQQFHAVNFVSLKDGDVVKCIRFKTPIVDIVANRTSIAITFAEKIAVFDARTLEDRLTVTTCYPCPGGLCPVALGDRWLAYAEKKLIPSKASAGGCFFDGVSSYTATVLNAAKSLGKGLRELGEHVAAGLTGNNSNMASQGGSCSSSSSSNINADGSQPGIVTILDIKHQIKDISPTSGTPIAVNGSDPIVAHFLAHPEAVTAMSFDPSGMLLLTADRRGHDFNVFRIHPHPSGSVLAAVHHLYVLHRGDTSAKVQDIAFSFDSRWVAVSSLRGTTHVFPITPYGGQPGYRTHSAPHVVNRLSRFHRSAGLSVDGRSSSPILMAEHAVHSTAFSNPRLPPFPHPTVVLPLAQLRQPSSLNAASSLTSLSSPPGTQQGSKGHLHSRQRHHSTEESHSKPLRVAAVFAKARSWLLDPPGLSHETPTRLHRRAVDSLFVIAGHGALIQYDLDPRHASNIPKEKVCDESPIELEVEAKAQWVLGSRSNSQFELSPPLSSDNWLIKDRVIDNNLNLDTSQIENLRTSERDDRWLSQVEIVTHAGPHRRLWMGPQFIFKTYNTPSGNSLAHIDVESVEVGSSRGARSTPMNIYPLQPNTSRPLVPVLIESGSCSSHEQSPRLLDSFHYESIDSEIVMGPDSQLREDLADAMRDCATAPVGSRDSANEDETSLSSCKLTSNSVHSSSSDAASLPPYAIHANSQTVVVSIVNPQGIVTTVTNNPTAQLVESFSSDNYIHENCDETMFRPVITVMSDPRQQRVQNEEETAQPVEVPTELIVPVIDERMLEQRKKEREMEQKEQARKLKEEEDRIKAEKLEAERAQLLKEEAERAQILKEEAERAQILKEEAERAQIFKEEAERAQILKEEAEKEKEAKKKLEKEKAQKKAEERKNKKAQKVNKKPCEPEKKAIDKKEKEATPPPEISDENLKKVEEIPEIFDQIESKPIVDEKIFEIEIEKPFEVEIDLPEIEEISLEPEPIEEKLELEINPEPEIIEFVEIQEVTPRDPSPDPFPALKEKSPPIVEKVETPKETKKNKKGKKYESKSKQQEKVSPKIEDFPVLPSFDLPALEEHRLIDSEAIMKISKHETIGDDDIEIIPHENTMEIKDSPEKISVDEVEALPKDSVQSNFIKNEDFYDIDDDLPPLEPLESFDGNFEPLCFDSVVSEKEETSAEGEKQEMKKKMSELLKDTNMIFAMCSSLKEIKEDDDEKSSQIQRSTSSSLTTNTTTATFASAGSNQTGEGMDSDYKSLELDLDDNAGGGEVAVTVKQLDEAEDISSFEATSSETDDSSSKRSTTAPKFKREDDEELRPLLQTSITSLSSPSTITATTTDANDSSTLPDTNQKSSTSQATTSNNGNKRKNKKKRR